MKKFIFALTLVAASFFTGCGGNTAESVSKKWCELNGKFEKAEGEERQKLKDELNAYEEKIEKEHDGDKEFMHKVKELTTACDD